MTIYNPHLLARQELIETFVARQPLLDELVDDLRRGGKQHHLLVGGRGSGKTTLLLRLAAAIEDDPKLTKKCIPLRFPEEQYNVSRPSDLWMNAIDALVDALERQHDREAATHLEASRDVLESLDEVERSKQSLALLEGWVKRARRLIVLLVDNLDLVLDRLSESLWELREALSLDNRIAVIGASSRFVEETIDYQSPFYDFFRVHELGPLSEEEARAVVLSLAQRANTPNVAAVLERDPARFKALFALTGGTPRTLALLHTVLALDRHDSIERDLDGILDQVTPYYKARFDDLPPQSQVIVNKVALHWDPITAAECQAATHFDVNVVSAQLNRLVKNGVLTKVSLPGPGKLGFQLSERFFNIWYLMRASRRLRRRLSWFVEFLRIFYGEDDLRKRAEELIRLAPPASLDSPAKFLAFASAISDEGLRRQLEFRAVSLLATQGLAAIAQAIDLEGEDIHLLPVVDRVYTLNEIRDRIIKAHQHWPAGYSGAEIADRIIRDPAISLKQKQTAMTLVETGKTESVINFIRMRGHYQELGERLLNAISAGEVPSFCDVKQPDEVRRILELASSSIRGIEQLVVITEATHNPLSDENLRQLLLSDPIANGTLILLAAAIVSSDWARARHLILFVIRQTPGSPPLIPLMAFLMKCIELNLKKEASSLLVEIGLAERWAPLYEAFRAIAEDDITQLDRLAPEMRATTLALFAQLTGSPNDSRDYSSAKGSGKSGNLIHSRRKTRSQKSKPRQAGPRQ